MLTKIPPSVQHAILALVAALLTWASTEIHTWDLPIGIKAILAALVAWAIGYLAPPVNTYGIGSRPVVNQGVDNRTDGEW